MSLNEQFDVYDELGAFRGTASRSDVHRKGLWHRTFQCWIYGADDEGAYVLFQLRHPGKDTFPALLDISCAGHLLSGETPADGVRELNEELGVDVNFADLVLCGVYAEEDMLPYGVVDREFCHLFALERSLPLDTYRLQPDEVSGLYRLRLKDVHRMLAGESVGVVGVLLQEDGSLALTTRSVQSTDFVPHTRECYSLLFDALSKHVAEA